MVVDICTGRKYVNRSITNTRRTSISFTPIDFIMSASNNAEPLFFIYLIY